MMSEIKQVARIQNAMTCNRFIFWLQKVPVLKGLFPDHIYANLAIKHNVGILVNVLRWLFAFGGKSCYLFLACALPQYVLFGPDLFHKGWPLFVSTLFFLSFFPGGFLQSDILSPTLIKYTCIRQMGISANACIAATTGKTQVMAFVTFTPALVMVTRAYGQPIWMGLVLSIELACIRLMAEWLHLWFYDKLEIVLSQKMLYLFLLVFLSMGGAYIPIFANLPLPMDLVLLHPCFIGILLVLGILSGHRLLCYSRYRELLMNRCKADTILATAAKAKLGDATFRDVKLKDSDLETKPDAAILTRYHGYDYLNALFFLRHRRILTSPLWWELGIVGLLFLAALVLVLVFPTQGATVLEQVPKSLRFFVFFMYFTCNTMGTRICKAMFYNCDISLLRYPWYREKNVVLKNFSVRLRHIAAINLTLGGAFCLVLAVLTIVAGATPPVIELIPFFLGILCLAVFFSIHPLFLYYIFQPYTTQLAVKNPFFKGLNLAVYVVCYFCMYMKQPPAGFASIIMVVTLLYSAAALFLVWKHSPRTFRVK